ncbi:MAG TPA: SIR2 family protein [Bryobacteraceae bacterium]|nr:SIR2 family protein [Bryobacteraceae bacterium]
MGTTDARRGAECFSGRIAEFVGTGEAVLFAGAGCSARLNIPIWTEYLSGLAIEAEKHEPEVGSLMRKRIQAGQFLEACTLFKRVLKAPPGDVAAALSQPFRPGSYDCAPLLPLMSLPFSAAVTTNYDCSVFDAWSQVATTNRGTLPQLLETRETKGAPYVPYPFVLFLHGRGSLPLQTDSMVFDEADYRRLYTDPGFTEGLLQLLSSRPLMFVGWSFKDPGLDAILRTWETLKGPAFPRKHLALLPNGNEALAWQLIRMNVEVVLYDPANNHSALWTGIEEAAGICGIDTPRPSRRRFEPLQQAREVLAMCYASATLGKGIEPLRRIALEGIILATISESGAGLSRNDLDEKVGRSLGMPLNEIGPEVSLALDRLSNTFVCVDGANVIRTTAAAPNRLSEQTAHLARAAIRRTNIREGTDVPDSVTAPLARFFEDLMVARAWDLAAHFVQPRSGAVYDIEAAITGVLAATEFPPGIKTESLKRGIIDLLTRPNSREAEILCDLGRLAFAVQLAFSNARTIFAYGATLPQCIYLDASVLMPAIVDGHPLHSVYWPVLLRLQEEANKLGGQVSVIAPFEFLNEIVSHRRNAIQDVQIEGLEDPLRLQREVMVSGAENLNVFVGAYATYVGRAKRNVPFIEFMKRVAPYEDETELEYYLRRRGLRVERLDVQPESQTSWEWFNPLKTRYEQEEDEGARRKAPVLIRHEALQLARLRRDHARGLRSIFVTADGRLRRATAFIRGGELGDALFSGLAMVKLIDLLLGVEVDHRALARLMWGVHTLDLDGTLRRYITDRGLQKQGDVETLVLPGVVEKLMELARAEPQFEQLQPLSDDSGTRATFLDFLDRFEDRFYELLDDAARRRSAKDVQSSAPPHAEHLSDEQPGRSVRLRRKKRKKG